MSVLTYDELTDEDKLSIDDLYKYKNGKKEERKILREVIQTLRNQEMDCTKDIMNLSQRKIGEKFELGPNSAKPLTKRNRENIKNRLSEKEVKKLSPSKIQKRIMRKINEKKICSENGRESKFYSGGIKEDHRYYGRNRSR